jgi:iron complex transport system substrate-binding protein
VLVQRFARFLSIVALVALASTSVAAPAGAHSEESERIVSLSPTATEMLFAIGAGPQVVAADDQSDYPARAPTTDLSGYTPNIEAIAGYEPDLVVVPDTTTVDQLEALGIDTLVLEAARTLKDTYAQLRRLGKVTGHADGARLIVKDIKSKIAKLVDQVPDGPQPTAYYELDETFFSADSSTFIGKLLELGGFDNIADAARGDGSGYPQLSVEFIVDSNPDVIFLADTECCAQSAETVARRPGFGQLQAVENGNVVELSDDVASRWGPRVVQLLRAIVKAHKQL